MESEILAKSQKAVHLTMEERLKHVEETLTELEECLELPPVGEAVRKLQMVSLESFRILSNMLKDLDRRLDLVERELVYSKKGRSDPSKNL